MREKKENEGWKGGCREWALMMALNRRMLGLRAWAKRRVA